MDTDLDLSDVDDDADGYAADVDCDDENPDIYPGAPEICDGLDNDCDGEVPEDEFDMDGDGVVECEEECGAGPLPGNVSTLSDCEYVPSPSGTPFAAYVEWGMTHEMTDPSGNLVPAYAWDEYDEYGGVFQAPMVFQTTDDDYDGDIDEDDIPDIAVIMANPSEVEDGVLRLISGDGTVVHDSVSWESHTNSKGTFEYAPYHYSGVAMGDVDGDGNIEILTLVVRDDLLCYPAYYEVSQSGTTVSLELDLVYPGANYVCAAHAPAIADIDDDGVIEMIWGKAVFNGEDFSQEWYGDAPDSGGRGWFSNVFDADGYWNSGYHSFAYDIDGDGSQMEVMGGNTVYNSDGTMYCDLGTYVSGVWERADDGYPAVADLLRFTGDADGEPEIIVTGNNWVRVYHGTTDYDPNGEDRCLLIDEIVNDPALDADVNDAMPSHPNCDLTRSSFGGQPTVGDFDGDGDMEIGVAGACWYSVYYFNENDNMDLERYAMVQTKDWSSASTGSTLFDFNGDGETEIVFSDEESFYVWGFDGTSGLDPWERLVSYLEDDAHKSWTIHEYPLVADVDGDGKAEIVVTNSHLPGFEDHFGIYVLGAVDDDWVSAREIWHQHAYYVTNVDDDGFVGYSPPNYAPYTSADHNNFRLQAPGSFGALAAPNATIAAEEACQEGCGDITVWVQVGNEGAFVSLSPDVVVSLYGVKPNGKEKLIESKDVSDFVGPGELAAGMKFEISGWDIYDYLIAVVDDPEVSGPVGGQGLAKECDEGDNEVIITLEELCP